MSGKTNSIAIVALNLFLGCTLIGWVVSLVWSLSSDNNPQRIVINQQNEKIEKDEMDKINKLKKLLNAKAITQEEFDIQKTRILNL